LKGSFPLIFFNIHEVKKMVRTSRSASIALTGGSADKISEAKFGGHERVIIIITNCNAAGGASCWLASGQETAANTGIQLAAGQSIAFSKDSGYKPIQDAWFAYAAAAGTTLAIYEEVE
jgi:hypothetical protein